MRIVTLILIALLITCVSFGEDRLDRVPAMSGEIEIMEQLGFLEPASSMEQTPIPQRPKNHKAVPAKVRIHQLADTMTTGD